MNRQVSILKVNGLTRRSLNPRSPARQTSALPIRPPRPGNIVPKVGLKLTSLAFRARVLTLHLISPLYPCPPGYVALCLRGQCNLLYELWVTCTQRDSCSIQGSDLHVSCLLQVDFGKNYIVRWKDQILKNHNTYLDLTLHIDLRYWCNQNIIAAPEMGIESQFNQNCHCKKLWRQNFVVLAKHWFGILSLNLPQKLAI